MFLLFFITPFLLLGPFLHHSFSSPWPDPNSSVLSKIDFGVPLVELFKWLHVRDTFLGENFVEQDIIAALTLARGCKHPDAEWLTLIFEGQNVSTKEEARKVFLLFQDVDARAVCFAWCLTDGVRNDLSLLRRAAEKGNAFACATLYREVWLMNTEEAFRLAQYSAAQHERDGLFYLARCLVDSRGCEKNLALAKENFLIAAELGDVFAASECSYHVDACDPARWVWFSRAAVSGFPDSFLESFSKPVQEFFSGSGSASIVFLIGRALKGNIDVGEEEIFGTTPFSLNFDLVVGFANQAIAFYDSQVKAARLAVDTWAQVATRLRLIKDMRILIGKMIWEARFEANYKRKCL